MTKKRIIEFKIITTTMKTLTTKEQAIANTIEDINHIMKERRFKLPLMDAPLIVEVVNQVSPSFIVDEIESNGSDHYMQAAYWSDAINMNIIIDNDFTGYYETVEDLAKELFRLEDICNQLQLRIK